MPKLTFPVILTDDVQIINRTDDGFYVIKYRHVEGHNAIVWLPETLMLDSPLNSAAGRAIERVKDYLAEEVRRQHPYLGISDPNVDQ